MEDYNAKLVVLSSGFNRVVDSDSPFKYPFIHRIIEQQCYTISIEENADPILSVISSSSIRESVTTKHIYLNLDFGDHDKILQEVLLCELERIETERRQSDIEHRSYFEDGPRTIIISHGCTLIAKLLDLPEDSQIRVFSGVLIFVHTATALYHASLYGVDISHHLETSPELYIAARALSHDSPNVGSLVDQERVKLQFMARKYMGLYQ